jgi:hypothetical protein
MFLAEKRSMLLRCDTSAGLKLEATGSVASLVGAGDDKSMSPSFCSVGQAHCGN